MTESSDSAGTSPERERIDAARKAAAGRAASPRGSEPPHKSATVCGYTVVRELHRGGQGVVFEAQRAADGAQVAIKFLRAPLQKDSRSLARFQREARLLSHLRHPGILHVYEAGWTEDEQPYLVTEYLDGLTLDAHVREFECDVAAILELFSKLTAALEVAHAAGVVHRDLKPANVIVDSEGEPHLLDFGLARGSEIDAATLTEAGDIFGTPPYMSPEQLALGSDGVDERTDVWSLGVMLYECLALARPFEAPTEGALFELIRFAEPPDLRRRNSAVSRDLATVVSIALAKNPERRYQSARNFAADLRALLTGAGIRARPVPWLARAWAWTRRSRGRTALVSVVAAALPIALTSLGFFLSEWPKIREAETLRHAHAVEAEVEAGFLAFWEGSTGRARRHFEAALALDPGRPCLEALAGRILTLQEDGRWEEAWTSLQDWPRQFASLPTGLRRLEARAEVALGKPSAGESSPPTSVGGPDALHHFLLGAEALTRARLGDRSAAGEAAAHFESAILASRSARALFHFQRAAAAALVGDQKTCRECADLLLHLWPQSASAWAASALVLFGGAGRGAGAVQLFHLREPGQPAAEAARAVAAQRFDGTLLDEVERRLAEALRRDAGLALAHGLLAQVRDLRGDPEGALRAYAEALKLAPGDAWYINNVALVHRGEGRMDDATRGFRAAAEAAPEWFVPRMNLAGVLHASGDAESALREAKCAVELAPGSALAHNLLGGLLGVQGDFRAAEAALRRSIEIDSEHAAAHHGLGTVLLRAGRPEEARDAYRAAVRSDPALVRARLGLADAASRLGLHEEAMATLQQAADLDGEDPEVWNALGAALNMAGKPAEAAAALARAVALAPDSARAHQLLSASLREVGEAEAALVAAERAVALDPTLAEAQVNLGALRFDRGEVEKAIFHLDLALKAAPKMGAAHYNLGIVRQHRKDWEGAEQAYAAAARHDPAFAEAPLALGLLRERLQDFEAAAAQYRECLRRSPAHRMAHDRLLLLLERSGEGAASRAELLRWAELKPDDALRWHELARVALRHARRDEPEAAAPALLAARRAVAASSEPNVILAATLALALAEAGEHAEAALVARRALAEADPGRGVTESLRAELQRIAGRE